MKYLYLVPALLFSATPALAITCTGIVNRVIVAPEGDIYVDFGQNGNARLKICQMGGSMAVDRGANAGGATFVNASNCQALVASFTTAMASGKAVNANVDRANCAFVDGVVPNPYPYQFEFTK